MKRTEQPSLELEQGPKQNLFEKVRNRLAITMIAGMAMGCASTNKQVTTSLTDEQRAELRKDILGALEQRRICEPFGIELERVQQTKVGLSDFDQKLADILPSFDSTVQKILLCQPENLRNRAHALSLLSRDVRVIRFLPEDMIRDHKFMLDAANIDARTLDYAHNSLFESEDFAQEIVLLDPKNIHYAFPFHLSNPTFIVKLMQLNPTVLDHLPKYVSSNEKFIADVGYLDPRAYLFHDVDEYETGGKKIFSSPIWDEKEYARLIVKTEHLGNLKNFSTAVRSDVNFMLELMKSNPKAYVYRDYSVRGDEKLMRAYLGSQTARLSNKGAISLNPEEINQMMADLKALDIDYPERFTLSGLRRVIQKRKAFQTGLEAEKEWRKNASQRQQKKRDQEMMENPKEPLTLDLAAKADWNGALNNPVMWDFLREDNNYLYFEAATKQDVLRIMDDLLLMRQQVDKLPIRGHGWMREIALGAPDPRLSRRQKSSHYYLSTDDYRDLRKRRELLTENAQIPMLSCSVGQGAFIEENIASTIHRAFPQARIFAAKVPTNIEKIIFNENGDVINVVFSSGEMSTLRIEPDHVIECLKKKGYDFKKSDLAVHPKTSDIAECRSKRREGKGN